MLSTTRGALGGMLLLLAAQAAAYGDNENLASVDSETPITALALVEAFRFNHAAVDELYLDKRIKVIGQLDRIERAPQQPETDAAPGYIVTIFVDDHTQSFQLKFQFAAKDRQTLAMVRRHHNVMLEGRCRGEAGEKTKELTFDDCRFIKVVERAAPVAGYPTMPPGLYPASGMTPAGPPASAPYGAPSYPPMAVPADAVPTLVPATAPALPPARGTFPPPTFSPPSSSSASR